MGISKVCCRCSTEPNSEARTPVLRRFSCGVGSVLNEIQSQLISFRLVFFMNVVGLSATEAGVLALYGKISQAAATPLCTFLEERIKIPFLSRKLGRRKSWHFIGTMLLTIVLPLYFGPCFPCKSDGGHWQLMVYILTLSTVLSTSVSLIELGHLTLIPIIAKNQEEAIELNALRTMFQFLGGVATYLVAWAILGQDSASQITAESSMGFMVLTLIMVGVGFILSMIFHAGTKEPPKVVVNGQSTKSEAMSKSSFVSPSYPSLQSMTYVKTDMKNEAGEDEFRGTISKDSFDENRIDDSTVLKIVKELPQERKMSVVMSTSYELAGLKEHLPIVEKGSWGLEPTEMSNSNEKICTEVQSDQTDITNESFGNDNKGLDFSETEVSPYHLDHETSKTSIGDDGPLPQAIRNNEKTLVISDDPESAPPVTPAPKTVRAWLRDPRLYMVAVIFSCAKVLQDVCFAYLPLFLIYSVKFEKEAIAYLPLIMLITGAVSSGISKKFIGKVGGKWSFSLSAVLVIGVGVWFYFITDSTKVMTYPAVVLLGFGFSIMIVNSLSFAAELIGDNKSTSGVVFAVMGLMSRAWAGAMFLAIQKFFPQGSKSTNCEECGDYVRHIFSLVPGSIAVIGILALLLFQAPQTQCTRTAAKSDASIDASIKSEGIADNRL
ncbi:major facilitator superfamily domain-containing protein 12-like [Porites lutea]|uniref:major facilitator superfamily domain-containing protein 12-like n=1 Tax=Porites lutea TaxID=51062 RepID=UPI003CC5C4DB